MPDMKRIHDFAVKWCDKFRDQNINYIELVDHFMADDCAALGFEMDCGHAFSEKYGQAVSNHEALDRIIDDITDIPLLGSAIYSRWRYFNHWAYTGEEILEPKNRAWFILALSRLALADHALKYANIKMRPSASESVNAFEQVGQAYIKMALYEPNLFQFVFLNGSDCYPVGDSDAILDDKDNRELIKMIAAEFQISEKSAEQYVRNTVIYTHGIASFLATGMMHLSEGEIMSMIHQAGNSFLKQAGIPEDRIPNP